MTLDSVNSLLAAQPQREAEYMQAAAAAASSWFGDDGAWILDHTPLHSRERLWICFALYAGTEAQRRLADAVVLATEVEAFDGHRFNIFTSNIAPILICKHGERMSPEARQALLDLTAEGHSAFPGDRQADYQFHGYNDNMPAKGTMSLIVGGQLVQSETALSHGRWQLRQFQEQLYRGGLNAEYNSPTYSALTLHAMAEIAEFAESPADREIARLLERRLWADLACHWHPTSHQQAGPHSRAYTTDVIGHLSCVRSLVWTVLGEAASGLSPMVLFDPPQNLVFHHSRNIPFNIAQMAWFVAGHYHLDPKIAAIFLEKPNPFQITATAEYGDSGEMPSRRAVCKTYMTPDYSLGTASTGYGDNGHPDAFFVTFPREGQEPVGSTVHLRYTINDEVPGARTRDGEWTGETDLVRNRAHYVAIQHGPTALVCCHPATVLAETELSRLSLMTIFSTHLGEVEELRVGEQEMSEWAGEFDPKQWIGVRAGRCLLALRPLAYSAIGLPARVRLETFPNYRVISLDNYRGEPRRFSSNELLNLFNGFVAEVAGVAEYGSLAEFMGLLQKATFEDYAMFRTRRLRYLRRAIPGRETVELATCYTLRDCSPRFMTVNGREVEHIVWEATGLPEEAVSVMPQGWEPRRPGIPWDSLEVFWYPNNPWAINENGR